MTTTMRHLRTPRAAWLLALLVWLLAAPAWAQVQGEIVSVGIGGRDGRFGLYRVGSWVPVRVRLKNLSSSPVEGYLCVEQPDVDGDRVKSYGPLISVTSSVLNEAGGEWSYYWVYYWPSPRDEGKGINSVVLMDKNRSNMLARFDIPKTGPLSVSNFPGVLPEDPLTRDHSRVVVVLGRKPMGWTIYNSAMGGNARNRMTIVSRPDDLPERALGFDGVDVLVWNIDDVPVEQVPAEFQRKAILDWVRSGGRLIVVVGDGWQSLRSADAALIDALPMTLDATRSLPDAAIIDHYLTREAGMRQIKGPLTQVIGTFKPNARAIGPRPQLDENRKPIEATQHPLAVIGPCGAGDVTLVTLNMNSALFEKAGEPDGAMFQEDWLKFWQRTAGWRGQPDPKSVYESKKKDQYTDNAQALVRVGFDLPAQLDISEETRIRILLALVFLGLYWFVAGPGGHLVLKVYKITHWSWWVFGGTVVLAAIVAAGTVFLMRIQSYQVRHRTFICSAVNSRDAAVTSFYGVLAPVSGEVRLELADAQSISYVTPLNELGATQSFPNPREYKLEDTRPTRADVPFRQTLKKIQARWSGKLGGIEGAAWYNLRERGVVDDIKPLAGKLTNRTGCTLQQVMIVWLPPEVDASEQSILSARMAAYDKTWKAGEELDLQQLQTAKKDEGKVVLLLSDLIDGLSWRVYDKRNNVIPGGGGDATRCEKLWYDRWDDNLLALFAETRTPGDIYRTSSSKKDARMQLVRSYTRLIDRTPHLRSYGAVLVARSGAAERTDFVPAPLALRVADQPIPGKGDVVFAYGLPLGLVPNKPK